MILCSLCLVSLPSPATEVAGLYAAAVPVTGQTKQERRSAIRQAFAAVLVKVAGSHQAAAQPRLQQALRHPLSYVQQFRYRAASTAIGNTVEGAVATQELWVRFDARAVNQLFYDGGVPVWGRARPATLVWLAVEDGGRRELLGADPGNRLQARLNRRRASGVCHCFSPSRILRTSGNCILPMSGAISAMRFCRHPNVIRVRLSWWDGFITASTVSGSHVGLCI